MIKIEIENSADKEQEYIGFVFAVVFSRINVLKKSINHFLVSPIDFNSVSFKSLKTTTKSIICIAENNEKYVIDLKKANYLNSLTAYIKGNNNLTNINLQGILSLIDFLCDNDGENLKKLLICRPDELFVLNNKILNDYGIVNGIDIKVLKLAFNYDYSEISSEIKKYFRTNNFVKYCPYCNLVEVEYRETVNGQPVTTHQLDHFFDKATSPLLSYSMYNLIPSDSTCNTINKLSTEFTDDYHLNPYLNGFENSMNFKPLVIGSKIEVQEIVIEINETYATRKYNQLIGNNHEVNEDDENGHGNVNVFKLLTKYRDRTKKAEKILKTIKKTDKGFRSSGKYLRLLNPFINKKENYLKWYFENIDTPFKYNEFNNEAYSKFNRDIHDYYYNNNNRNTANRHIIELIRENIS